MVHRDEQDVFFGREAQNPRPHHQICTQVERGAGLDGHGFEYLCVLFAGVRIRQIGDRHRQTDCGIDYRDSLSIAAGRERGTQAFMALDDAVEGAVERINI